ncbi:hypothetical protein [Streptomyces sp. NBC_01198]|uniref:hypothetical protein n=1 Tax=Streptomyces sp. NBC_01198 TaxID=2903769 RepID=UPI002E0FFD82|nr:hypothetical protein OG702_34615 [Streptomyces sp. NBC_01198]
MEPAGLETFDVPLPALTFTEVPLAPRPVLHGVPGHHLVHGRVYLGNIHVTPLNAAGVERWSNEEMATHARHLSGQARFCLLSTAVNFHHHDHHPVLQACLNIQLREDPPAGGGTPVVFDLYPPVMTTPVKSTSSSRLRTDFKFAAYERTDGTEAEAATPYVDAEGQGCSDALWNFTRRSNQPLAGHCPVRMVIQIPPHGSYRAFLGLTANVLSNRITKHDGEMPPEFRSVELHG